MGNLYVVATPIGNLEDISFRAVNTLKQAGLICCEDTRVTNKLLMHFQIKTPVTSFHQHSDQRKIDEILEKLQLMDVALVTDAGTPLVSDPGFELVKQAIAKDIRVIPIPGPSAVVTALMGAGINADRFVFLGFLPKKDKQRQELLNKYRSWEFAIVVYESPNRVKETLRDMQQILGERNICIGRELTKMHEEFVRGPIAQVLKSLENKDVLGEVVMVIEGKEINEVKWDETMIVAKIKENLIKELPVNLLAKEIAKETGWNKSDVYKIILKIKK